MKFKTITLQKLTFYITIGLIPFLTSCNTFQQVTYDNNKINLEQSITNSSDSDYYKNYFTRSAIEFNALKKESKIFNDMDTYKAKYVKESQNTLQQQIYNGSVTISAIDNGWMRWNTNPLTGNYWQIGRPWNLNGSGNGAWVYTRGTQWSWTTGVNQFGYNPGVRLRSSACIPNVLGGQYRQVERWRIGYDCGRRDDYNITISTGNVTISTGNVTILPDRSNAAISRRDLSTHRFAFAATPTRNDRAVSVRLTPSSPKNSSGLSKTNRTVRHSSTSRSNSTRVSRPRSTRTVRSNGSTRNSSRSVRTTTPSSRSSSGSSARSSGSSSRSSGSRSSSDGRRGRE